MGLLAFRRPNALASRHLSRIYAHRGGGIRVFCGVVVLVPSRRGYPVRVITTTHSDARPKRLFNKEEALFYLAIVD
jgi:hypothetical protein